MQAIAETPVLNASFFSEWEIVLILAVILILAGAKHLPEIGRGFRRGSREFGRATRTLRDELDEETSDAGRSLGGIYGKPAREALTPDNQTAELYDPAALRDKKSEKTARERRFFGWRQLWQRVRYFLARLLRQLIT